MPYIIEALKNARPVLNSRIPAGGSYEVAVVPGGHTTDATDPNAVLSVTVNGTANGGYQLITRDLRPFDDSTRVVVTGNIRMRYSFSQLVADIMRHCKKVIDL